MFSSVNSLCNQHHLPTTYSCTITEADILPPETDPTIDKDLVVIQWYKSDPNVTSNTLQKNDLIMSDDSNGGLGGMKANTSRTGRSSRKKTGRTAGTKISNRSIKKF